MEKTHDEQVAACRNRFGTLGECVRHTGSTKQTAGDPLTDLAHTLGFIQTELHKLMDGTCSNRKICSPR
jgi:hypothetical protein